MTDSRRRLPPHLLLAAILAALLAACTSERPNDPNDPDDSEDDPPSCVDGTTTTTIMVAEAPTTSGTTIRPWTVASIASASSTIAHRQDGDGSLQVAIVDGAGTNMLASIPSAGAYRTQAAVVPGTSCAVVVNDVANLIYGCAGAAPENPGIDHLNANRQPIPFQHPDGSLSVLTQSFSSFTILHRSAAGVWSEHDQYESSISYPTDIVAVGGNAAVCFISSGDHAVIQTGSVETGPIELVSAAESASCHLEADGTTLHVLTDGGYTQLQTGGVPGGPFAVTPVPALGAMRVRQVFMKDGAAYALATDDVEVKAVPLAGGDPIVIAPLGSGSAVEWDASSQAVRIVTSRTERSTEGTLHPQTIEIATHCME